MATTQLEILTQNKNRAKRDLSSGTFTMAVELPGGNTLTDGAHVVGKIEGNIAITRVILLVRKAFDGTTPTVTLADDKARTYFTTEAIATARIEESALTAHAATRLPPLYETTETTFTATIVGGSSTVGELAFIVDYVQLDTVVGKHTV